MLYMLPVISQIIVCPLWHLHFLKMALLMRYCRVLGSLSYNDFASYLGNLSLSQKVPYLFFQLLNLLPLSFFM